jgi:two-component system, NtrC family, sensor kinase
VKASILIVGHPFPDRVQFGADHCANYDQAIEVLKETPYAVVVAADRLPVTSKMKIVDSIEFLKKSRDLNRDTQTILISQDASPQELQKAINAAGLFKIIPQFETDPLQLAVREALEEYELIKQNQAFVTLTKEQHERLQHLTALLEEKVQAREKFLVEAREKLLQATHRTEALNRALVAIQKSVTKQEIEQHLTDALHVALGITWIRILFNDQTFLDHIGDNKPSSTTIFSAPLFRDTELLGHIYFARDKDRPFTPDEDDFLLQVGDAVGLAMDRLRALDAIENLKQEWDSTFDAITDPVAIIGENYYVIRANKTYAERSKIPLENIAGKKCHELLFNSKTPCDGCKLGSTFDLGELVCTDGTGVHFAVTSHPVPIDNQRSYALFYRDVGEEQKMQRQILESSKMAEIGTIGSSIAHEINNPLGGMIAFLQILKGELKPKDKIYDDIVEMEQAAIRCKTIVENLLAFTRQSVSSEMKVSRIGDLFKLVTNIMELQTRGLGIKIEKQNAHNDAAVSVDANQLVQVLVNVMQNSCEAIAERIGHGQRLPVGKILLKTSYLGAEKEHLVIEIVDNGTGIKSQDLPRVFTPFFTTKEKTKNPGLGLSVSYQIVKEHGGQMEISSVFGQSTTVTITLNAAKSPTH